MSSDNVNVNGNDDREARFLASQSDRLNNIGAVRASDEERNRGARDEVRSKFWAAFRAQCSELNRELDSMLLPCPERGGNAAGEAATVEERYATAAERAAGSAQLDTILASIRELERHCGLLDDSYNTAKSQSSSLPSVQGIGSNSNAVVQLPPLPDILPPGDVRLLTDEITALKRRLDDAREIICPPELFVFRRYRALIAARKEEEKKNQEKGGEEKRIGGGGGAGAEASATDISGLKSNSKERVEGSDILPVSDQQSARAADDDDHVRYGASLQNKSSCSIIVQANGSVIESALDEEDSAAPTLLAENDGGKGSNNAGDTAVTKEAMSSILIKDVDQCRIILKGQYQSIHIVNATKCTIGVSPTTSSSSLPVSGPVHVTACHDTTIAVACRQLRIHDCTDVTFRVHVRSGPIIENSRGMTFRGDFYLTTNTSADNVCGENMYYDVKDFNWLRALVQSPNFVVIRESQGHEENEGEDKAMQVDAVDADEAEQEEESSEDEDEL